jgi:hypothetical protein
LAAACAHVAPVAPAAPPSEKDIVARSHEFFAAVDRGDQAAAGAALAPGFVQLSNARTWYKGKYLAILVAHGAGTTARSFANDQVTFAGDAAIYTAQTEFTLPGAKDPEERAIELVWVRAGAGWQLAASSSDDAGVDAERLSWNKTFRAATGFNLSPNKFLMEITKGRKPGKALDAGMGQGRNGVWLASQGWDVTGVDISDEGLRVAEKAATSQGLTIHTVNEDFEKFDLGADQWDLVDIIYAPGTERAPDVLRGLRKGGLVVVEYFHADEVKDLGIGGFKTGELEGVFKDGFRVVRSEIVDDIADWGPRDKPMKLVRFAAEKL